MSYGTKDDPIEIMEGVVLDTIKDVKKDDVRIKYLGTTKLRTRKEHKEDAKKWERQRAKAKISKQLKALPDKTPEVSDETTTES